MAAPVLKQEQIEALMTWLAADYHEPLIQAWFKERGWPKITQQAISYHRMQLREEIEQRRNERREKALATGLALKEERVERLKQHADALEEIKWIPGKSGKLHNEKAWREVLEDIAAEVGGRRSTVEITGADGEPFKVYLNWQPQDDV